MQLGANLKSLGKSFLRHLRGGNALELPKTTAELEQWERALGVKAPQFKKRISELTAEAAQRSRTFNIKQARNARQRDHLLSLRRRRGRNGGSVAAKRLTTAHNMLMGRGRVGRTVNKTAHAGKLATKARA